MFLFSSGLLLLLLDSGGQGFNGGRLPLPSQLLLCWSTAEPRGGPAPDGVARRMASAEERARADLGRGWEEAERGVGERGGVAIDASAGGFYSRGQEIMAGNHGGNGCGQMETRRPPLMIA